MRGLSSVTVDILGHTHFPRVCVDVEQRVQVLTVKAVRQRVLQRGKVRAVCVRGNNLKYTGNGRKVFRGLLIQRTFKQLKIL